MVPAFGLCGRQPQDAQTAGERRREPRPFRGDIEGGQPCYLMPAECWDEDAAPIDPEHLKQSGEPRKGREGAVPLASKCAGRWATGAATVS